MSKRHKKMKMFAQTLPEGEGNHGDFDPDALQAPKGKRPRGKGWGKAKRASHKTAYYD